MTIEEIQKVFLEGFEQVVLPHIPGLETDVRSLEAGMTEIRKDVGEIQTQLNRMEQKLDNTPHANQCR